MPSTLDNADRAKIRRGFANQQGGAVNWLKSEIDAAADAIDAKFNDEWRGEGSTAVDAATTFNFTNNQKKKIFKFWLDVRFGKE